MTLVLVFVFSLCSVLVPIESFAEDFALVPFVSPSPSSGSELVSSALYIGHGNRYNYDHYVYTPSSVSVYFCFFGTDGWACFSISSFSVIIDRCYSDFSGFSNYAYVPDISVSGEGYAFYSATFASSYRFVRDSSIPYYSSLNEAKSAFSSFISSTSTIEPTATPTPEPSATPSIFDAFQPFRSFSGTYYNREALYFPDSVTSNRYEQYSGIVSNHDAMITDIRSNIDYYSDSIVYKFEYDLDYLTDGTTYDFSFLYDSDQAFGYVYAYYTVNGIKYDITVNQNTLTGTYTVCGCAPYPSSIGQLTPNLWEFNYNLSNQRAINLGSIFTVGNKITLTVIVSVDEFPYLPSGFDWSQFFQDTRPDNVFLYTLGGLASLPFFISGLSFLALGALIGIILKFMR